MTRGIAAAFVPQTELEQTGLAVHPRPRRPGWRRVATAAVALAGLVAGLSPATAAAAEPPVPVLDWQPCAAPSQQGFECATAQVPLDYGDPQGATIDLAVIRHPAPDPAQRLGALFFNAGGPGGSGTAALPQFFNAFPAPLRARFDVLSWDPRGIGASTAVQCFATRADEQAFFAGVPLSTSPWAGPRRAPGSRPTPASGRSAGSATATCWRTCRRPSRPRTWTCCARPSASRSSTTSRPPTAPSWVPRTPTSSRTGCGRWCWTATSTRWRG